MKILKTFLTPCTNTFTRRVLEENSLLLSGGRGRAFAKKTEARKESPENRSQWKVDYFLTKRAILTSAFLVVARPFAPDEGRLCFFETCRVKVFLNGI